MEFYKLRNIVVEYAQLMREIGWSNGSHGDEFQHYMCKLNDFKFSLMIKHDLRPSEFENFEVGEPIKFKEEIEYYKNKQK